MLTLPQVADRLGVSKDTVRRLYADGRFPPPLRIGKSHRWETSAVEAWLADQRAKAEAERAAAQGAR